MLGDREEQKTADFRFKNREKSDLGIHFRERHKTVRQSRNSDTNFGFKHREVRSQRQAKHKQQQSQERKNQATKKTKATKPKNNKTKQRAQRANEGIFCFLSIYVSFCCILFLCFFSFFFCVFVSPKTFLKCLRISMRTIAIQKKNGNKIGGDGINPNEFGGDFHFGVEETHFENTVLTDEKLLEYTTPALLDQFRQYIHCLSLEHSKFWFVNDAVFAICELEPNQNHLSVKCECENIFIFELFVLVCGFGRVGNAGRISFQSITSKHKKQI